MTKTLYLMRHGQTLFNKQGKIQGWCDSPLTEDGIAQAKSAREFFQKEGIQFDGLYSSTQERASDTLELASGRTDYHRLKELKEANFGDFEGAQEFLHIKNLRPGAKSFEDTYVPYGGENFADVAVRVDRGLRSFLDQEEGDTFLAVSHAGAMYSFYLSLEIEDGPKPIWSNCAIYHYEYDQGNFRLVRVIDPVNQVIND